MNYITFAKELKEYPAFNLKDVARLSSKVYYHRLDEWQKKGYITRIANGVFTFADNAIDENYLYYFSNKVCEPSYVSLESALSHYGFIPETVYSITAITTKKTKDFDYLTKKFYYHHLKRSLFFGYRLMPFRNRVIRFAEPEKALLDFFYLKPHLKTLDHVEELRLNPFTIEEQINWNKIENYLAYINNKQLTNRINNVRKWYENA